MISDALTFSPHVKTALGTLSTRAPFVQQMAPHEMMDRMVEAPISAT